MLSQAFGPILFILVLANVALCFVVRTLWVRLADSRRRLRYLVGDLKNPNLEQLLHDHLERQVEDAERIKSLVQRLGKLEKKVETAQRYVGIVRYDAFEDVAGGQSFSMALYDESGDGAIITSLVGRSSCRVYCKALSKGKSETSLSKEEKLAINQAVETRTGALVSR